MSSEREPQIIRRGQQRNPVASTPRGESFPMVDKTRTGNAGFRETLLGDSGTQRAERTAWKSAGIKVSEQCRTLPRPSPASKTRKRVTREAAQVRRFAAAIRAERAAGRLRSMADLVAFAGAWR